jgi:hypothetical protein
MDLDSQLVVTAQDVMAEFQSFKIFLNSYFCKYITKGISLHYHCHFSQHMAQLTNEVVHDFILK